MATTTAPKVPATVPASRVPALPSGEKSEAALGGGSSGGFKLFVWMLVILNLAAAGAWLWFKYFKTAEAQKTLATTRRQLIKLETDLDNLHGTVQSIARDGVNEVSDVGRLVGALADSYTIRNFLLISTDQEQRFHKTNYQEKSTRVTFLNKKVYKFSELVLFLTAIEKANPTVQIKEMDFGTRQPASVGSDTWVPTQCVVRTLQLQSGGR